MTSPREQRRRYCKLNKGGLGRRDFLRVTATGSVGLLACGWSELSVAATANDGLEIKLRGASVTLRGGQPQVVMLAETGVSPWALTPQAPAIVTEAERQTPAGPASARTFTWSDSRGFKYCWTVSRLQQRLGVTVQMNFTNDSSESVRLREFDLLQADPADFTVEGRAADWFLSTLDSHDSAKGGFHPSALLAPGGEHDFLDTMTLYTENGAKGLLMGAVGPAVSDVRFHCRVAESGLGLAVKSEMNDVVVDPGETRCSEEVLLLAEPFDAATPTWFRWVAATHGSRTARGPLAGWCSWYSRGKRIDAQFIGDVCTKVQAERDRLPLDVIQIDDGWQEAYGDWEPDLAKFPDGMKVVADQIRSAGAMPGIWLCPVRTSETGAHPDGTRNEWQDASHPAVQAFIRKMLTDHVAEGYRYFKLDFLWIRNLAARFNQKKTRLEMCRDVNKLYRESIGEDSYLLSCVGGLNRGCFGYADGARIGTDTSSSLKHLYDGVSLADCIDATGSTAWANGIVFANDPDVTYLNLSKDNLLRTWYGYVGLLGGMMLTSETLNSLDETALRNLEALIPPAPDKGRAFDGQTDPWHRRFGFVARRPWGSFASVQLWNPTDQVAEVTLAGVPLNEVGKRFHAWSFWDEKYLGVVDQSFALHNVPAYGSRVLRLTPAADDWPVVIGSNLHIAMGSAELKQVVPRIDGMTIELTDAGARGGALYLFNRGPLRLISARGCEVAIESTPNSVWKLKISGRQRGHPQKIELAAGERGKGISSPGNLTSNSRLTN